MILKKIAKSYIVSMINVCYVRVKFPKWGHVMRWCCLKELLRMPTIYVKSVDRNCSMYYNVKSKRLIVGKCFRWSHIHFYYYKICSIIDRFIWLPIACVMIKSPVSEFSDWCLLSKVKTFYVIVYMWWKQLCKLAT